MKFYSFFLIASWSDRKLVGTHRIGNKEMKNGMKIERFKNNFC